MFPWDYIHSDVCSLLKFSTTPCCVTRVHGIFDIDHRVWHSYCNKNVFTMWEYIIIWNELNPCNDSVWYFYYENTTYAYFNVIKVLSNTFFKKNSLFSRQANCVPVIYWVQQLFIMLHLYPVREFWNPKICEFNLYFAFNNCIFDTPHEMVLIKFK